MNRFLEKTTGYSLLPFGMIVVAAFSRLIPHWPNFTAIGAMALFAGSTLGFQLRSVLVPVVALLVTDLIFGFHSTMIAVYGATIFSIMLGAFFLQKRTVKKVLSFSILGSMSFFIVTNFAVWAIDGMYSKDLNGLLQAYTMALPFFPSQIFGDLFFGAILFGSYALLARKKTLAKI